MMRRGYRQCRNCTAAVPAASRKCNACGHDQKKRTRDSSADSGLSPVHQTRIAFRDTVHIRSAEAARQCAPTRRRTGHSSRRTAAQSVTHIEGIDSDGDHQEDGGFWQDTAEEAYAGPPEPVSPVSRGVMRLQGESSLQQYIRVLRLSPHRWVLVGESPSGAACYAMAGYDCSRDGGISIMVIARLFVDMQCTLPASSSQAGAAATLD